MGGGSDVGSSYARSLDLQLLFRLSTLLQRSSAHIVVSSSWRLDPGALDALVKGCRMVDIPPTLFVGATPEVTRHARMSFDTINNLSLAERRVEEIHRWLDKNQSRLAVQRWAALDVAALANACPEASEHMVRTACSVGLQDRDVELAISILTADDPEVADAQELVAQQSCFDTCLVCDGTG